jgi:hypothetical protein
MSIAYNPQVNDYVVWTTEMGQVHQGWVYFVASEYEHKRGWPKPTRYISIEIDTKPRPECDLSTFFHKRIHVCLCCYEQNWHELKLVKRRKSKHDDTIVWEAEKKIADVTV